MKHASIVLPALALAGYLLVLAVPEVSLAPDVDAQRDAREPGAAGTVSTAERPSFAVADPHVPIDPALTSSEGAPDLRVNPFLTHRLRLPEGEEPLFREGRLATRAPGSDTSLCASWEPTVATDPNDQRIVAVAQSRTARVSFDGGDTFTDTVTGVQPRVCDDGVTGCNVSGDCTGIGTGACNAGQCSNNAAQLCSVNSDCGFGPGISCNGFNGGDPSVAFDSQGRMFITYLCRLPGGARDVCISGYRLNAAGNRYFSMPNVIWPVRVTVQAGRPGQNNDKQWLVADWHPGSPYRDRLHMVWVDLAGSNQIYASFSDDQGVNWSPAANISPTDGSDGTVWPPHLTVAPNGDLYVTYHSQTGFQGVSPAPDGLSGRIVVVRSPDGGSTFSICDDGSACGRTSDCNGIGSGTCNGRTLALVDSQADTTFNVQHLRYCDDGTTPCANNNACNGNGSGICNAPLGAIPGARFWTFGTAQAWVLADPDVAGRIYVVTNDDPDNDPNSGDAADVVIARSDDFGATWPTVTQVDDGPAGTFQLLPTAAIDPISGAIGVTWYDNRAGATNAGGNFLLDLRASFSYDSGASWSPSIDINDGQYDPDTSDSCRFCNFGPPFNVSCATGCASSTNTTNRIGEYNGIAFGECTAHMAWADNLAPGCGGDTTTYYDRDPEAGGDVEDPVVACPADLEISCTESSSPTNTGFAGATDNCATSPDIGFVDTVTPGACPQERTIDRSWNATDNAGNLDTCAQTLEVVDDGLPVVTPPAPIELECNTPGGVSGNDPQILAWLAEAMVVDDCGAPTLSNDAPALFPASCPPGDPIDVTFTGTDECGNAGRADASVTVIDSTMPVVTCEVRDDELWPVKHELVDVGLSFTVVEVCDADPTIVVSVTSDEDPALESGAGGEIHCPDAMVEGDRVLLRSERSGNGDGRVYTITVTASDDCGNQGSCQATVSVPMSMNPRIEPVDSGQAFDPAVCPEGG